MIEYETVLDIAQSQGIVFSAKSCPKIVVQSTDFFIHDIISAINRLRKHKHKKRITSHDLNEVLIAFKEQPLYGYSNNKEVEYEGIGQDNNIILSAIPEKKLDLSEILGTNIQEQPYEMCFGFHWLAISGFQPFCAENQVTITTDVVSPEEIHWTADISPVPVTNGRRSASKALISEKIQKIFVSFVLRIRQNADIEDVLNELQSDGYLPTIVPYLLRYLIDSTAGLIRFPKEIMRVLKVLNALFCNPALEFDKYINHFLSIVITPLLTDVVCEGNIEDQYSVRDEAALMLPRIITHFSSSFPTLLGIVIEKLSNMIFSSSCSMGSQYGAIVGLINLDIYLFYSIIVPKLAELMNKIHFYMDNGTTKQRIEAKHLSQAIISGCKKCKIDECESNAEHEEIISNILKQSTVESDLLNEII